MFNARNRAIGDYYIAMAKSVLPEHVDALTDGVLHEMHAGQIGGIVFRRGEFVAGMAHVLIRPAERKSTGRLIQVQIFIDKHTGYDASTVRIDASGYVSARPGTGKAGGPESGLRVVLGHIEEVLHQAQGGNP